MEAFVSYFISGLHYSFCNSRPLQLIFFASQNFCNSKLVQPRTDWLACISNPHIHTLAVLCSACVVYHIRIYTLAGLCCAFFVVHSLLCMHCCAFCVVQLFVQVSCVAFAELINLVGEGGEVVLVVGGCVGPNHGYPWLTMVAHG